MSIMKTDSLTEPKISVKRTNSDALDPTKLPAQTVPKQLVGPNAKATQTSDGAQLTKTKKLPVNADTVERQAQHTRIKHPVQRAPNQTTPTQRVQLKPLQPAWLNKERQLGPIAGRPDLRRVDPEKQAKDLGPVAGPPHLRRAGALNQSVPAVAVNPAVTTPNPGYAGGTTQTLPARPDDAISHDLLPAGAGPRQLQDGTDPVLAERAPRQLERARLPQWSDFPKSVERITDAMNEEMGRPTSKDAGRDLRKAVDGVFTYLKDSVEPLRHLKSRPADPLTGTASGGVRELHRQLTELMKLEHSADPTVVEESVRDLKNF
jgi:hypothetical protein